MAVERAHLRHGDMSSVETVELSTPGSFRRGLVLFDSVDAGGVLRRECVVFFVNPDGTLVVRCDACGFVERIDDASIEAGRARAAAERGAPWFSYADLRELGRWRDVNGREKLVGDCG